MSITYLMMCIQVTDDVQYISDDVQRITDDVLFLSGVVQCISDDVCTIYS